MTAEASHRAGAAGSSRPRTRHWRFRTRLTALIAVIFVLGGAVLLAVQYQLAKELFSQGIGTITACVTSISDEPSSDDQPGPSGVYLDDCHPDDVTVVSVPSGADAVIELDGADAATVTGVVEQAAADLSEDVLSGLLLGSVVTLAVFAVVAVGAASWLSRRSLGRISDITRATREISQADLDRRLDLPGPADEIKELGDTIDGMLQRLEDAFTRQERFVAAASHELRTPLTTTRTALEIPLAQGRVPTELVGDLERALTANRRSERLISSLLVLARGTHHGRGAEEAPDEQADLAAIARQSAAEHADDAAGGELTVWVEADEPAPVAADPGLVAIAVGNLLDNAVRHNVPGGRVEVAVTGDAHAVRLTVANDGDALDSDEVARLTEPFNRGRRTRLAGGGTGLGLTLVETIARSLGGSLELAPRDGGGLTARLELPARR